MKPAEKICELSVIIPVLDEAHRVEGLLRALARQEAVVPEIIVCDGGSLDRTVDRVLAIAPELPFPVTIVPSAKGRGRQMNAGVRASRGDYLLFLHADSDFRDDQALRKGLDALIESAKAEGCDRLAGHFSIKFQRRDGNRPFFYYYLEHKARLGRKGSIHGDQGFLTSRRFFFEAGRFDESCPVMEDTRFAEEVRRRGRWILLPADIFTSARRFETEGETARQVLNAVLMTLAAVGREDFIGALEGIYSIQREAGRLRFLPFLKKIAELLQTLSDRQRRSFWDETGKYLCENAWQLAFVLDARRGFLDGLAPGEGKLRCLTRFDRRLSRFALSPPLRLLASCSAWTLFHGALLVSGIRDVLLSDSSRRRESN